jgi:hypothetical protein
MYKNECLFLLFAEATRMSIVTFSGKKVTKTFLKELRPKPFTLRIRLRSRAWSWEPAAPIPYRRAALIRFSELN